MSKVQFMRRMLAAMVILSAVVVIVPPAGAKLPPMKVIGTDRKVDAIPGLDLTRLSVGSWSGVFGIKFDIAGMLLFGGVDESLPGLAWMFTTGRQTFVAEAFIRNARPRFVLFKLQGGRELRHRIRGGWDWQNGYVMIVLPLDLINAKRGTTIHGVERNGDGDANAHVRVGNAYYADTLTSTKSFRVP